MRPSCVGQVLRAIVSSIYLKETEERGCEVSRLLCKDDFVRANLMFAELDDNIRVLLVVEKRSREAICRCHGVVTRKQCAVDRKWKEV